MDAFCRSVMSTVSSGRSEAGKNCCGTKRTRKSVAAKAAMVTAKVIHLARIAASRKRP